MQNHVRRLLPLITITCVVDGHRRPCSHVRWSCSSSSIYKNTWTKTSDLTNPDLGLKAKSIAEMTSTISKWGYINWESRGGRPPTLMRLHKIDFHCFVEWFNRLFPIYFTKYHQLLSKVEKLRFDQLARASSSTPPYDFLLFSSLNLSNIQIVTPNHIGLCRRLSL